ncbi:30S ribosomal protein S6 [Mycoplasmopsis caviae]|uniref:Small ribosomal subunit protein bS6 n=1 Tax=Mycoplasmopsis caviae TaxID=55603 RepID=A0A3P8LB46_9BACT|nr:30S ribosomal protein S6 [Mycoplasmopsis caviae]UUD34961.1 30S ribosomal protein S6 [Mycoplasmopsis caviae]VDR42211.1 30S ribosomal protein S6 [Mycoplasmopsis caviae]
MHKYEIMMILDPKSDASKSISLVESIFKKSNIKKAEKLERTDLAYPINGSLKAQYLLFELEAESNLIAELTRRVNISKEIWRHLVINLDTEKGYGKVKKESRRAKFEEKREFKKVVKNDETKKVAVKKESQEKEVKPRQSKAKKAE